MSNLTKSQQLNIIKQYGLKVSKVYPDGELVNNLRKLYKAVTKGYNKAFIKESVLSGSYGTLTRHIYLMITTTGKIVEITMEVGEETSFNHAAAYDALQLIQVGKIKEMRVWQQTARNIKHEIKQAMEDIDPSNHAFSLKMWERSKRKYTIQL